MNYLKIISVGIVLSSAGLFAQDSSGVRMVGQAFPQWAETFDMEISDDVLFVANGRLDIIDVSNPENPDYIWYSNRLGYCNQVEVIGDRAYVTTGYLGEIQFYVLDISDLANPQILGKLEEDHVSPLQLKVSGNIAYIISHHSVRIYDFSEPEDIMNIAVIDSTVDFMEVDIERNYLFGYDPGDGLRIIDVSDPASPRQVNFFPYHIHITDFSYANQKIFLFVSTYRNYGVTILDVQDVMNIDSLNHIPIYNREGGVISVQDSILLTSSYGSICSYNVSDMENPIRTGRSNIGASCIAVNDLLMFVRSGQQ